MGESKKQQHTPTPWHYQGWDDTPGDRGAYILGGGPDNSPDEYLVGAALPLPTINRAECEANARFIVRAVNSHQSLVEALRAALPKCDEIVDRDIGTPCGSIAVWVGSFARHYCDDHHKVDHHPMRVALAGREALVLAEKES